MRRAWVGVLALLLPYSVWAQSTGQSAGTSAAAGSSTLPTINVPVPKQKGKRAVQIKRPPAKRAAPVRTPAATRTVATPALPADGGEGGAADAADTIGASPIPGSGVARDKVPSNAVALPASTFDHTRSTGFLDAIGQFLPGVSIGDQTGNQFQRDVNYRGFTASPVIGTPQGLAVYQNGVRIN